MLTDESIKSITATSTSYLNGCQYYQRGHVRDIKFFKDGNYFTARVVGSKSYTVEVFFDANNYLHEYDCNCPVSYSYSGLCKHLVAVLKCIQLNWETYFPKEKSLRFNKATQELLDFFTSDSKVVTEQQLAPIKLVPTYVFFNETGTVKNWLTFMIGNERLYVLKDIPQLLMALDNNREIVYGKNFTLKPREMIFDQQSKTILKLIQSIYHDDKQLTNWSYSQTSSSAFSDPRNLKLTNSTTLKFFTTMENETFTCSINNEKSNHVPIIQGRPTLSLSVKAKSDGLVITTTLADDKYEGLDTDYEYIFHNDVIYKVDNLFSSGSL